MKVLLVWPKSRNEVLGWGDLGAVAEPLSLEYLASVARDEGHEVELLDMRLHPSELACVLDRVRPDVVGVTAFSMHVSSALEVCREVKAADASCTTIVGGHHATLLPEDFFAPQIDIIVCGEGTGPFRQILRNLIVGAPCHNIAGVWTKSSDTFRSGGPVPPLDLSKLPAPDRTITIKDREHYFIDWMRPIALLRTSVGCPFRCTFCSLWKIADGHYHQATTSGVINELREIPEEFVFLIDDEAFINGRRMTELALAIRETGIRKRYFAYCRMDTLIQRAETLRLWRSIGLERLFVGIDAISEEELSDYNKRIAVAQIERGLEVARELGIEIFAQFVVNPLYREKDFTRLIRFIEHHKIKYPSFTVLTPIPGTDLLKTFDSVTEMQPNQRPNWDLFDCQNAVTKTALSKSEFRRQYRNLYKVFKGSYLEYREHPVLISQSLHDGDVGDLTRQQRSVVAPSNMTKELV